MAIVDVAYIVATGNSIGLRESGKGTNRNSSDGRNIRDGVRIFSIRETEIWENILHSYTI